MPIAATSSDVRGVFAMASCSHITNQSTSGYVRTLRADKRVGNSYHANMARRGIPKSPPKWFLREWMAACDIKKQTDMMELTGWSKATMSQLYNGKQDYSPKILEEASEALNVEPFELLMLPERAMAMRRFRETAAAIVELEPKADPEPKTEVRRIKAA